MGKKSRAAKFFLKKRLKSLKIKALEAIKISKTIPRSKGEMLWLHSENERMFNMKKIAYIRISPHSQTMNSHVESLKALGVTHWFIESRSGTSSLKLLLRLLTTAKLGDEIYIYDFSRIASTAKELLDILEHIQARKLRLISVKDDFDSESQRSKFFIWSIKKISELERSAVIEQTREGIAEAMLHMPRYGEKIKPEDFKKKYVEMLNAGISKTQIARIFGFSRQTLYNKLYESFGAE